MISCKSRALGIQGIALDEESRLPIILLKERSGDRILPVRVGPFEASAIIMEIENIHPLRPLTHDILAAMFRRHGFKLNGVRISSDADDRLFATITYSRFMRKYEMEVRPSDGIALALRLEAPISGAEETLNNHAADRFFLSELKPFNSDFLDLDHRASGPLVM